MHKEQSFTSDGLTTKSNGDMGIDVEEMPYITPLLSQIWGLSSYSSNYLSHKYSFTI